MINGLKTSALILARKNSIGLPGKNYQKLCGVPLFLWSVRAALQCPYIDSVVVCSCCSEVENNFQIFKNNSKSKDHNKLIYINRPEILNGPEVKNEAIMRFCDVQSHSDIWITLQPTFIYDDNNTMYKKMK